MSAGIYQVYVSHDAGEQLFIVDWIATGQPSVMLLDTDDIDKALAVIKAHVTALRNEHQGTGSDA